MVHVIPARQEGLQVGGAGRRTIPLHSCVGIGGGNGAEVSEAARVDNPPGRRAPRQSHQEQNPTRRPGEPALHPPLRTRASGCSLCRLTSPTDA